MTQLTRVQLASFLLALGAAAGVSTWFFTRPEIPMSPAEGPRHEQIRRAVPYNVSAELVAEVLRIEAQEKEAAETVWAKETLAQECGRTIERWWEAINAATNKLEVAAGIEITRVQLGRWTHLQEHPHGIRAASSAGKGAELSREQWRDLIDRSQREGWVLEQTEFRHNRFELDEQGMPKESRFYFSAHLRNGTRNERVALEGDLVIRWGGKDSEGNHPVQEVDASALSIKSRVGEPPFRLVLDEEIVPQGQSKVIDPLIVYDLDGDGLSEIVLAARNLVYRNQGNLQFKKEDLCRFPEEYIGTALMADFNRDGYVDFLCAKWEGIFLFEGSAKGKFDTKARLVWKPAKPLEKPMALTCGDIDADGDLDLFLGQYREPYHGGATPKPFHDANDGEPSYLLKNESGENFHDATEESGLAGKRWRRTYSASFSDLDGDRDLDLTVVSDFAGADVYRNEGGGRFTDVTREWVPVSKAFGMAHALNDFNNDGEIDLLMMGMTSATADRLASFGLERQGIAEDRTLRERMTHGNRLYLGRGSGFEETAFGASIARSGWSWGCSAFDFDNDGWVDVYVGNGLESNSSVTDYESEYWLHDRFVGLTNAGSGTDLYFRSKFSRTRAATHSYGGYEKNRFYVNRGGQGFFEVAYLLDVALPEDSRNVVSCDLDGDGRVDLLMTTYEIWPRSKQTLKVFRNALENGGNWIGFRLKQGRNSNSWEGTEMELHGGGGSSVRQIVTGDSFRSQHAAVVHFGLGTNKRVERVEIKEVGKEMRQLQPKQMNQYYDLSRSDAVRNHE